MIVKRRYTLSAIEPAEERTGYRIRAFPSDYEAELVVFFDTHAEAENWLRDRSQARLATLQSVRPNR